MHVEHHQPAKDYRGERQSDRQQREPGELQAQRGQSAQCKREHKPCEQGAQRHDERELDHGENR
jgi:hypothetical protein